MAEVDRVAAVAAGGWGGEPARRVPVMVRVTTGVHAGGHEYISTAHEDQKFGLSVAGGQALAALEAVLARPELDLLGIHSHIGSADPGPRRLRGRGAHRAGAAGRARRARTGVLVPEVDLGGGFGVAYLPDEVPLDPVRIAKDGATTVADACAELGTTQPRISIEPGRAVVGPTTLTLYRVGTVKPVTLDDGSVRTYVSVDGGMSDNLRPALYGARYHAALVSRRSTAPACGPGWSASTARAATSWCTTSTYPATWRPATCSRSPSPVRTGAPWPRTTTWSRDRRW